MTENGSVLNNSQTTILFSVYMFSVPMCTFCSHNNFSHVIICIVYCALMLKSLCLTSSCIAEALFFNCFTNLPCVNEVEMR